MRCRVARGKESEVRAASHDGRRLRRGRFVSTTPLIALCCLCSLPALTGCNSFGNGKLIRQLQNENDRLLSEFRAERNRREEAEQAKFELEDRLAESEKLLAQQAESGSSQRLSSLPGRGNSSDRGASSSGLNSQYGADQANDAGRAYGGANSDFRWLPRK